MTHANPSKKLASLLNRMIAATQAPEPFTLESFSESGPLEREFLYGFLLWDSNSTLARAAFHRLIEAFVDLNHLRVAMPEEVAAILGDRYPKAEQRAARLRASLQEIFRREHSTSLSRLSALGKRETRHYLDSLEGMHGFVVARLMVFQFGSHAVLLDDRLRVMLTDENALDPALSLPEAQHWLEHQVQAEHAQAAACAFLHWIDSHPVHRGGRDDNAETKPRGKSAKKTATTPRTAKPKGESKNQSKGQPKG